MNFKTTAVAALVSLATAGTAQASTVVNGSFEDFDGFSGSRNWQVYNSIDGWSTVSGAGIEIQSNATLGGIDAQNGDKYVELDSHNAGSNSKMAQSVELHAGSYRFSFYYAPRTTRTNSNGIEYSIGDFVMGTVTGPNAEYPRLQWTLVTEIFEVDDYGFYDLSFAATGREDTLGGLIDNVDISAVPLPASAMFLLGGLGLLGATRRRKA